MQFDVSHLRALAAVHDFGSVQRASQLLGISQPAVSSSIRHLEADLGIELFSRTPKGMMATPAGVLGALCAKRILAELRKMKDDIASIDGGSSGLRSEEHTSELQSLMRISYAVFCLKTK